ncbi:hypothetical protein KVR01_012503 [Diaporthe batatas]|uniref:uncharacterized protein n=1 Tax=Diaporthe batatas TaxID=748121 RepID=UPI001D0499EF|nr:uncharacterized protein KVR01_012503 [Diaporthe batatas]KAG8157841.1 hypothetical protein KVR01_012503 [Diaporthe batatas]
MKKSATPSPPRDEMAQRLFLLRTTVVAFVTKALDRLRDGMSQRKLLQPAGWYFDEWDKQELNQWPRQKPRDSGAMPAHLTHSVLRWRAEHSIRQALECVEGQYLLKCLNDILADQDGGPTQSQLDVSRGLVRPRIGLHLGSDAWRIPDSDYDPAAPNIRKKVASRAPDAMTSKPRSLGRTIPRSKTDRADKMALTCRNCGSEDHQERMP